MKELRLGLLKRDSHHPRRRGMPAYAHGTCIRLEQTGGERGERRFSSAGRAGEYHKLTGVQIKVHTVENRSSAVGEHNTVERHYGLPGGSTSVWPSNVGP